MRRQIARSMLLIATALFAGCVVEPAGPDAPEPTPAREPEPVASEASAPETPPEEPSPTAPAPQGEPSPPRMSTVGVALNGRTPTRLCLPAYQGCRDVETGQNTSMPLDALADPVRLTGTLTWNASTPATDRLYASLVVGNDRYYLYRRSGSMVVNGESPMHVSFDLTGYGGERLALVIHNTDCLASRLHVATCAFDGSINYGLAQDFVFEGQLTGWD